MDDTRLKVVLDETQLALEELDQPLPDSARLLAILNDAQCALVDVIDGGIGRNVSKSDLNHLDSANAFLRRAITFSQKEWAASHAYGFIATAREHVSEAYSADVVPLHPGGGAA